MRITLPFDTAEMLISRREDDEAESGASPRPTGIFGSSSSRSNSMTSPLGDRCVSRSDALMSIRQALYLGAWCEYPATSFHHKLCHEPRVSPATLHKHLGTGGKGEIVVRIPDAAVHWTHTKAPQVCHRVIDVLLTPRYCAWI
mmetsp:Transcript_5226/g.11960  ORF Transcript_5226/g.11960 Transcript_5226/m.11960 type:complete len:143 (-) Transcript_5226:842-1270(-)